MQQESYHKRIKCIFVHSAWTLVLINQHFHPFALCAPQRQRLALYAKNSPVFHLLLFKLTPGSSLWRIIEVLHAVTEPDDKRLSWWCLKEKLHLEESRIKQVLHSVITERTATDYRPSAELRSYQCRYRHKDAIHINMLGARANHCTRNTADNTPLCLNWCIQIVLCSGMENHTMVEYHLHTHLTTYTEQFTLAQFLTLKVISQMPVVWLWLWGMAHFGVLVSGKKKKYTDWTNGVSYLNVERLLHNTTPPEWF